MRVVIVGAGHAGGTAAALLRNYGFEGEILLIGAEPQLPYQRPPLSKACLHAGFDANTLRLKADEFYAQQRIETRTNTTVTDIDATAKTIRIGSITEPYDVLILATGSRPRRLTIPGIDLSGVMELRTLADAQRLLGALKPGAHLVVIGGGYIGLEVAASARSLGVNVDVLEREERILARVASPELSAHFHQRHTAQGVNIHTRVQIDSIVGEAGAVTGVRLCDGTTIACNAVLVGVGAQTCDELAQSAGLKCENGIVVDEHARTSDPSIYAIGDVSSRTVWLYEGGRFRLESVANALEQAKQAVCAILKRPPPAPEVPWFWSDQYRDKLQIAGLSFQAQQRVTRRFADESKLAVFHLKDERILAVEAVNCAPEFMIGKKLIGNRTAVVPERLADAAIPMQEVAR